MSIGDIIAQVHDEKQIHSVAISTFGMVVAVVEDNN
jgi:hypothetical protein